MPNKHLDMMKHLRDLQRDTCTLYRSARNALDAMHHREYEAYVEALHFQTRAAAHSKHERTLRGLTDENDAREAELMIAMITRRPFNRLAQPKTTRPSQLSQIEEENALRKIFESKARDPSYKFARSRKGNYVNPAVSRDWKWFNYGYIAAREREDS